MGLRFLPEAVLVGVGGGSSLQPLSPDVRLPASPGVPESPLIVGHVERGVADEAGAGGDLAVTGVRVGVSHPVVTWRRDVEMFDYRTHEDWVRRENESSSHASSQSVPSHTLGGMTVGLL